MSPYKSFVNAAKTYLESIPFFKFLLSANIYVFSLGGALFLLGSFLILGAYDLLTCIGGIIVFGGLLLTLIKEDMLTMVIASGSLAFVSLVAWIVGLVAYRPYFFFRWHPLFYFLIYGAIAVIVFLKSERFKQMRTEAAAKNAQLRAEAAARDAQMRAEAAARNAVTCPRCGTAIPNTAGFCPNCGAPNPAMQQYAPPAGQYVPPQYAPPAGQQPYAPSAGQYAPPQYTPPQFVPPQYAPSAAPVEPATPATADAESPLPPSAAPAEPASPDVSHCVSCGAELPAGAVFCGKCGTKQ